MGAPSLAVGLDACLKATLVLCLSALAARARGRASAATRHLIWTVGLASALALPLLSTLVPVWRLPLLPAADWSPTPQRAAVSPERDALSKLEPPAAEPVGRAVAEVNATPVSVARQRSVPRFGRLDRPSLLWLVWLAGAALVLAPLGAGTARIWWMRRRQPLASPSWSALAREVGNALGLRRPILLFRGGRRTMPMAWGLLRPAILLPEDAEEWPEERRRAALTHELAHVVRRDCLTQAIAHLACALYWFHPLVWVAARRMRAERERACDDLVLRAGATGPDYAHHLLQIARGLRACHSALATVAMARPSQLEGRLLAILDPSLERGTPSRPAVAATMTMAVGLIVPLAGLEPWEQPPPQPVPTVAFTEAPAPIPAPNPSTPRRVSPAREARAAAQPEPVRPAQQADPAPAAEPRGQQERVIAALSGALRDTDGEVRREAVFALGQLGAVSAAGAIAGALADADPEVRQQAAFALGQIRAESAVEALGKALAADADADVRTQAAFALGQIRSQAAEAALAGALADREAEVRKQAVFALGQIRAPSSVEPLAKALRDADPEVREQAAFALGEIRDERAVPGLVAALEDAEADVRQQAVFALGQLRAPRAVDGLRKALQDAQPDVRKQAAFALGQIRSPEAVPALMEALRDKDAEVRAQAVFALGEIGDERAAEVLTAALKDPDSDVRKQAAFALGQLAR